MKPPSVHRGVVLPRHLESCAGAVKEMGFEWGLVVEAEWTLWAKQLRHDTRDAASVKTRESLILIKNHAAACGSGIRGRWRL